MNAGRSPAAPRTIGDREGKRVTDRSHIVVVGASLAGTRAVEAIRRTGFDARVSLVGAEKHFPPVAKESMECDASEKPEHSMSVTKYVASSMV